MKNFRKAMLLIVMTGLFTTAFSQERPVRIGLKFGYPQLAGLNLEYVTPVLSNKLSADADISYFSLKVDESNASYTYFSLGANYYFMNEGRGLYGGLGFSRQAFGADLTVTDPQTLQTATAKASFAFNNMYLKIGGKHGGLFYFRWNLGYAIALNDGQLEAEATFQGRTEKRIESTPISGGGIITDVGFGFSF